MAGRWRVSVPVWSLVGCLCGVALTRADTPSGSNEAWTDDLSPISAADWNDARAAHLLERAGFGATPAEITRVAAMTPQQAVDWLVDYEKTDNSALPAFDESGIWDPGMDPFPPSRAEAVRRARERGEGLGEKVLPIGAQRRLQPVVDKFFYSLLANGIETQRLGFLGYPLFWCHGHRCFLRRIGESRYPDNSYSSAKSWIPASAGRTTPPEFI